MVNNPQFPHGCVVSRKILNTTVYPPTETDVVVLASSCQNQINSGGGTNSYNGMYNSEYVCFIPLQYDINGKGHGSQDQRAYYLDNKHGCLDTGASGKAKILETDGRVRKITRNEAERLQGVPDNYTNVVSKSQALKMLGNGWTVDVIAHIFKGLK